MTCRIKKLADPHGVLAPNVVLTRDDGIHLKSFKSTPPCRGQRDLSANRTCEMGLRQATGYPYESSVFLLEELTRPA